MHVSHRPLTKIECITYHHTRYNDPTHADTPPFGAPPVDIIIGAAVGAISVVLIIIITVVSIVLMRRKRGMS